MKTFITILLNVITSVIFGALITCALGTPAPETLAISAAAGALFNLVPLPAGILSINFGVTPQQKAVQTARKFGQKNLEGQQGTTRIIYDSLELSATSKIYRFFENCNTRQFPFTNLGSSGKLEAGELLTVQYAYLDILTKTTKQSASEYELKQVDQDTIWMGELSFENMNTIVMKPIRLLSFRNDFNKMPNGASDLLKFDTKIMILPLIDFCFQVKIFDYTPPTPGEGETIVEYLQLTIEGVGSLLSPKATM